MTSEEVKALGLKKQDVYDTQKGPSFIRVYANNVQMGITMWDMSLSFGEIVGIENERPQIEQKVKINMPAGFVKALSNLLAHNLAEFERKHGEIQMLTNFDEEENAGKPPTGNGRKPTTRKPRSKRKT
ncbi:MAG: DUF3467 domain-containing protein [Acidobacteria bacterium]|nr:DUF3467 domain-containing protein [Acidobacteriota bacterium]